MNRPSDLSRRRFLQIGAVAGGGLTFGMSLPGCSRTGELPKERFVANAWVTIHPDNRVVFLIDKIEMGQGVITSMSMLLADELEVPWDRIETETAGESEAYRNLWGLQATGGSLTIRTYWQPLRQAAATVRAMLCQAAADHWGTETGGCLAEQGVVRHLDSGRSLTYGQLAGAAAQLTPPDGVAVKSPDQFRYIGKPMPLRERASKSDGSAEFGIDVQLPGLLTAVVVRCPVFGGKVASFDGEMALAVPGVLHVVQIPDGIGVVAESYWAARSGAGKLRVEWDNG
ncbi:MAG: molybdopterin-dependent oxidoreductase, partial [Gammaproteobacteria bacterium]|nr:molybdopterin-dependent oxidoreductase [Gammaproteobacteria bacterium]